MDSIVRIPTDVAFNGNVRICLKLMLIEICEVNVLPILRLHHFCLLHRGWSGGGDVSSEGKGWIRNFQEFENLQ